LKKEGRVASGGVSHPKIQFVEKLTMVGGVGERGGRYTNIH